MDSRVVKMRRSSFIEGRARARWFCLRGLLVALVLGGPTLAFGQASAQIRGVVTDAQGAVLPGANVTLLNEQTGVSTLQVTGADGRYRFGGLPVGRFSVQAEMDGFQTLKVEGLVLTVGFNLPQDLRLEIAAVAETVIVTGETPLVQVESTEISSIVSQEQITQLPVLNRSYLSLALLVPGTSADVNRGFFESVQVGGGAAFNSTGNFVDGVTNNWVEDGEPRQDIPEDAVEQFKVANAQFKPEYGMATAGVIQTVTKSGTNNVHGTGYWYFRDKALNAIGEFEEEKPAYRRRQFGGSIGGPIVKDEMHFFGVFEATSEDRNYTVTTGRPDLYGAFHGTFPQTADKFLWMGRYDWAMNNANRLFATLHWQEQENICPACGGTQPAEAGFDWKIPRRSITVGHNWLPGPSRLNEFRFQHAWNAYFFTSPSGAPFWTSPGEFPAERFEGKLRRLSFPSFTWGQNFDEMGPEKRWEFKDSYTMVFEKHSLKVGGSYDYRPYQYESTFPLGAFTFGEDQFFDGSQQAIDNLRDPELFSATIGTTNRAKPTQYWYLFAQDDWQIKDNLTLYLGLRYERLVNCCNEEFDPAIYPAGSPPIPRFHDDLSGRGDPNNFAPRFGLAWDVSGEGRTGLNFGYGVYYGHVRIFRELGEFYNFVRHDVVISKPSYPDPYGGRDPFEFVSTEPPFITVVDNNYVQPYAQQFTLGFQHQINNDLALEVNGIYNLLVKEQKFRDINPVDPVTGIRPLPQFSTIRYVESTGNVQYRAFYLKLARRFSDNYQYVISYTLAKVEDNAPLGRYIDQFDKSVDFGYGNFDRRHALVASASVLLPYDIIFGGIFQYRSQLPFSAAAGRDLNGDGFGSDLVPGTTRNEGGRGLDLGAVNAYRALNGLGPINQIDNGRLAVLDFRVAKGFPVGSERRVELMLQVFNLLNTTNFGTVTARLNSGRVGNALSDSFGQFVAARDKRQIELAVKFIF
jgi:hypothetical protein